MRWQKIYNFLAIILIKHIPDPDRTDGYFSFAVPLADRGLDTGRDSLDKEAENRIPD